MASLGKTVLQADLSGTVKWFDYEKGYGFIKRDDNGGDLFVHSSEIDAGYTETGEKVNFDVAMGRKGQEAVNVIAHPSSSTRRELRSVFRQIARLQTLFGEDDEYDDDDDDESFMNFDDDSDLDDFLRYYQDTDYSDDSDDDYDEETDVDEDDEEEEERPDKYVGLEQMFYQKPEPTSAKAPAAVIVCSLCDEESSPILFHPCQHQLCCSDCSIRLRKCPQCKEPIARKEKENGTELEVETGAKYTDLLKIVQAQQEAQTCQICMENKKNTVFGCGHLACQNCSKALHSCHICRQKILVRTKIFEI